MSALRGTVICIPGRNWVIDIGRVVMCVKV